MYGYVYFTTNLITGDKYIGQHKAKEFNPNYHGSGKHMRSALSYYGWDNFETKLLEWYDSKEALNEGEVYYISLYNAVERDDFYNIAKGGNFGFDGSMLNEESRRAIGEKNRLHRIAYNKARTGVFKHSEESKEKTRKSCKAAGPRISAKMIDRIHIKNVKLGISKSVYEYELEEYFADGWELGVLRNGAGHNKGEKGKRMWVKNVELNKSCQILIEQYDEYVANGYIKGRIL